MFNRKIIHELENWSVKPDRKPLILRVARQVGKTTLVELFAEKFKCFISLNLDKKEDRTIFETQKPFRFILDSIFFLKQKVKAERSTLIFIDEIQNSPEAVALLRYFYEEAPDIYVIAAGSLFESLIGHHISFPVGRVEYLALRPCSFEEFLGAMNEAMSIQALNQWPLPEYAHNRLQGLFNTYALIGGMPGVVANYSKNKDLVSLNSEYLSLIAGYMDDVEKYAPRESAVHHIRHIIRVGFRYGC